jgi:Fe-S cluster assembly protein SufD
MTAVMEEKDAYLSAFARFERTLPGGAAAPLHRTRQAAIERFAALGFPTLDDEEWRFTPLAPLTRTAFRLEESQPAVTPEQLERVAPSTGDSSRLVFVNGRFAPALSSLRQLPPGTVVRSLADAFTTHRELVEEHLTRHADFEAAAFTALNTAFVRDGAFVHLPAGKVVEEPIHLVFVGTAPGGPVVAHPRTLIVAGAGSSARVVESYVGTGEDVWFTNAVTEVVLGDRAVVDHCKVQRESRRSFHVHTLQVKQGHGSTFSTHSVTLGGGLVRNEVNAVLDAERCECTLNGLYLGSGSQLIDNHTRIDHARPNCASHELYKGILDGKARGVFNGKIYVHPDAQKTDAKQTNQTLLLSEDAVINTKPQLEIYADDVKCTHGATVGQLDANAVFYLRSRGLGLEEARALLTFAFANDIIGRIRVSPLRAELEDLLLAAHHLPRPDGPGGRS